MTHVQSLDVSPTMRLCKHPSGSFHKGSMDVLLFVCPAPASMTYCRHSMFLIIRAGEYNPCHLDFISRNYSRVDSARTKEYLHHPEYSDDCSEWKAPPQRAQVGVHLKVVASQHSSYARDVRNCAGIIIESRATTTDNRWCVIVYMYSLAS